MEQDRKPDMYLITQDFPYGPIEDSFVKPEYPYLRERFHVSVIAAELSVPEESVSEGAVHEQGIEACMISRRQGIRDKLFSLMRFLCERDCYTEIAAIIKSRQKIWQRIYRALMFGAAAETFYRRLKKKISLTKETRALFYFYWFDYKCFGLTMHRHKFPHIKIIARTHGYELYDERELYGKQFFKPQTDAGLERLIFAAQYAKSYYLKKYRRQDDEKYPVYRLGVSDRRVTVEDRKKAQNGQELLLVSCSGANQMKRIHLIIEGLAGVKDAAVCWVHMGDGKELDALRSLAEDKLADKPNIRYEFTGSLPNADVVAYYQKHYVGCFITTTQTEGGSPVSVQEALSFGVPVIAVAVGELAQMVQGNGILLSENPSGEEISRAIEQMSLCYGTESYWQMCERSLAIFREKFDAQRNFSAFAEELVQIMQ